MTEMHEDERSRRKKYEDHGLTYQPQIYMITSINSTFFYVKFDEIVWRFASLLKTVDIVFKTFQVMNLQYPYECSNTWTFIQKHFYQIKTKYDISSPSLQILLKELSN